VSGIESSQTGWPEALSGMASGERLMLRPLPVIGMEWREKGWPEALSRMASGDRLTPVA